MPYTVCQEASNHPAHQCSQTSSSEQQFLFKWTEKDCDQTVQSDLSLPMSKVYFLMLISFMCHVSGIDCYYHNNPKYWDSQVYENSADPDQMPQNAASDQGLHRLPLVQQYFKHINM